MALFQDVTISGEVDGLAEFRRRLGSMEVSDWHRDRDAEARFLSMKAGPKGVLCVRRDADSEVPSVALWFVPHGPGEIRLANMIPLERGATLSEEQFLKILADFNQRLFAPADEGLSMEWRVLSRSSPEAILSEPALRKFKSFARSANRQALHSADLARWNDFLVQIHCDGSPVGSEILTTWLRTEGWPDDVGMRLIHEFESARALLAVYDEELAAR